MTDATLTDMPGGLDRPPRGRRSDNWIALFGLGFSAGVGVMLAVSLLQTPGSLTDSLRKDRAQAIIPPIQQIPVALLPTDLSPPPEAAALSPNTLPDTVPDALRDTPARDLTPEVSAAPEATPEPPAALEADDTQMTVAALEAEFESLDYDLTDIRTRIAAVPRLSAAMVPGDLEGMVDIPRRKDVFFRFMLPLVLIANERLEADRVRLFSLKESWEAGRPYGTADLEWLTAQFESYRVDFEDWDALLRKVDVIPPSLALAQGAIESGWGTSRFAQEGNALFGQWVWGEDANGIVPAERQEGMTHKIRAFDTPLDAVIAYIKNLNTHRAYRELRSIRATLREQGAGMNGLTLAEGLEAYSEKGRDYIRDIRRIIHANELRPLDAAKLRDARA